MSYIEKMKGAKKGPSIPELVVELMEASTKLHILHLRVTGNGSYAAHKTLNELYDALPGHADTIAEGYQGATGKLLTYPDVKVKSINTVSEAQNSLNRILQQFYHNCTKFVKGLKELTTTGPQRMNSACLRVKERGRIFFGKQVKR